MKPKYQPPGGGKPPDRTVIKHDQHSLSVVNQYNKDESEVILYKMVYDEPVVIESTRVEIVPPGEFKIWFNDELFMTGHF